MRLGYRAKFVNLILEGCMLVSQFLESSRTISVCCARTKFHTEKVYGTSGGKPHLAKLLFSENIDNLTGYTTRTVSIPRTTYQLTWVFFDFEM